jgi:hypothetical protein
VIEIGEEREGEMMLIVSSTRTATSIQRSFRWTTKSVGDSAFSTRRVWDVSYDYGGVYALESSPCLKLRLQLTRRREAKQ